jgi:hypothetical protein
VTNPPMRSHELLESERCSVLCGWCGAPLQRRSGPLGHLRTRGMLSLGHGPTAFLGERFEEERLIVEAPSQDCCDPKVGAAPLPKLLQAYGTY